MEEEQALLYKEQANYRRTYPENGDESQDSSSEDSDEWWEESCSSCSSCCNSHSESSLEWESEVTESGQLFYIESDLTGASEFVCHYDYEKPEREDEDKTEKAENVKGGRLINWMRRRDIKKLHVHHKGASKETNQTESQNIKKQHQEVGATNSSKGKKEVKEISVKINRICEGSSLCQKLLGLTLGSSDNNKIAVVNIQPDGPMGKSKDVSVGDILWGINNFNITCQNVDNVLRSLNFPCEVLLKFERNESFEKPKNSKHQSSFVKALLGKYDGLEAFLLEQPVGAVVVDMESQNLNKGDIIYSYPEKSVLSSSRGAFVTLFHLLAEINPKDECQSSSVIMRKQPTHILYKSENNFLLLIAIPKHKCTIKEATYIVGDLIRNLLFNYQTLKRCFEKSEKSDLDHFFSLFFSRILTNGFSSNADKFVHLENVLSSPLEAGSPQFDDVLPHAAWVPLPKEAQIQIDDGLNELEANDIEHEEENILENQRLFHIIGSCLFHKGYLLLSHLPKEDLLDVYSFCRQNCLIQLFRSEPVKSLVIWKEVFPQSVNRGVEVVRKSAAYPTPSGKWFMLMVGQGYDLLAVILEAGVCCAEMNGNAGPAVAYVEEAKDTLRHMQKLGISSLASQWIESNSRFKTITPEEVFARKANKKKENLLGFVKSFDGNSKASGLNILSGNSKSSDTNPIKRTRGLQQDTSEDSVSQTASASEVSDENAPILGRRAERGRIFTDHASNSDSDSSDWDSSKDSNMRESTCSSGADNFYMGDLGEIIPAKLTTGPDYLLFNYIHLDGNEGVLVSPPHNFKRSSPKMREVVENFRRCAQIIHSILENNIKFKKNNQEISKAFINKSLIAVKEHGVLFECFSPEHDSHKKPLSFTYWIVGRLFFTPQPREVYVCYYDDAPQNLVEIAFRLGLSAAG